MIPLNETNVNTPQVYDEIYAGDRRQQMVAISELQVLLPLLMHPGFWVLDVGCGVGQYFRYLRDADHVTGIDFAPEAAEEALASHEYLDVLCQDFAQEMPFGDSVFDVVFCSEVIEHVEDPQRLTNEMHRILKDYGGVLILTTPYKDSINIVEHLWAFDEDDLRAMLSAFSSVALFRYTGMTGKDLFEHFLVLARK